MNGAVYTGVVVKTSTVPLTPDTCATVQKSEIVYAQLKPFVALNDEGARAMILAAAINEAKVNPGDPAAPLEVRITKI